MPTFEDLPIEIILEVVKFSTSINPTGNLVEKDELCKLRLVSSRLNVAVYPVLFERLHLIFDEADTGGPDAPDCLRCQEIINALADGSTRVFEHTKELNLCTQTLFWTEDDRRAGVAELKQFVIEKIFDAVPALRSLRTVSYIPSSNCGHEEEELTIRFIGALSMLPMFEGFTDLRFLGNPSPSFTLQPLRNLKIFWVLWAWDKPDHLVPEIASLFTRCPDLSDVYLGDGGPAAGKDVTFAEIFAEVAKMEEGKELRLEKLRLHGVLVTPNDIKTNIRHFRNLGFLDITNNPSPTARTTFGSICTILQGYGIYLKGVSTDIANDPLLLSYLSSYSGLIRLTLGVQDASEDSPQIVEKVYTQVLPKHRETLECLQLGSMKSAAWSSLPTETQLAELVKCQKLKDLEVYSFMSNTGPLKRWFEVGLQLPNLMHLRVIPGGERLQMSSLSKLHKLRVDVVQKFRKERGMKFRVNYD